MSRPSTGSAAELRQRIEHHLERLGLKGLDIDAHLAWVNKTKAAEIEATECLLAQAVALKRERSIEWRIQGSGLKVRKTMAAFDWAFQPKLDRRVVEELFTLSCVASHEDVATTMIYCHVLNRGGRGVVSPADRL